MWGSFTKWCVSKLGGFNDIDEYLEGKAGKEKIYILTRAVKILFNTIGSEDILRVHESGQWMFEGKPLNEQEKLLLISEATQFLETRLWKVLQKDIQWQTNRKMFLLAKTEDELTAGKLWLLTLDAFKTRLESMKGGSAKFNNKTG